MSYQRHLNAMSTTANGLAIRSVCLTLGLYRNLTTLTASVLALHTRCQVLVAFFYWMRITSHLIHRTRLLSFSD